VPDPERPPASRRAFLDAVAAGTAAVPIGRVYRFDQIVQAHTDMEQNGASGKLVVTTEMASDGGRSE
jgi:NADPH2:quinone reductase